MADTALPPLDKVDPVTAWQPWQPTEKDPWSLKWAGHLYRRAGFGANLVELRQAVKAGHTATVERVLQGDPDGEERQQFLIDTGERVARQNNAYQLRGWWLYAILHSPHPLREKMTVFWHNHFVSSVAKVARTPLMFHQNKLLREHALGKLGPFVLAVSKDPAMIVYLDNNSNVKGKPNENYARELMELFTLGVGNYTEQDIRQAARAFTGWHTDDDQFEFNARYHDDGEKTVFGKTGNWNGEDIVRLCLEKDCCARFLVRKLYRNFISESHDPPAALIEPLAEQFRKSDYDLAALVKTMLSSRHFFSGYAHHQRIKSPVEYVIGSVKAVAAPDALAKGQVPQTPLIARMEAMGQQLFAPPNVKGWPGGKAWLNTSTVLARHNFAFAVASGQLGPPDRRAMANSRAEQVAIEIEELNQIERQENSRRALEQKELPPPASGLDAADIVKREKATKPTDVVRVLLDALLQAPVGRDARLQLETFVGKGKPQGAALDRRIRETVHMIMTMPEYQLA